MTIDTIRSDFDRLAQFDADGWNHNNYYHSFLLRHVPQPCHHALEIGCGTGSFARLLAQRSAHVTALDLSPEMIRIARARSTAYTNLTYEVANVQVWDFPADRFDCIVSIATLHHMPLEPILEKMKRGLRAGGVLLVLDLYEGKQFSDLLTGAIAMPLHFALRLLHTGRLQDPPEVRAAWAQHGQTDHYLPVSEVRRVCNSVLPGARVTKHLLWRYSIVWQKPAVSTA